MNEHYESLQEELDGVRLYDGYFMALCPFHEDSKPSFMVHEDGYYCKSCRKSGSLEYLRKYLGHKVIEIRPREKVVPVLPQWRKWIEKYETVEGIARAAHGLLTRNSMLDSFFVRRQINQFINTGMFGWLDWWNLFPVFDMAGNVIDIVVRGEKSKGDTKYVLLKKQEEHTPPPLYVPDWGRVLDAKVVYVVYGIIDSWALFSLGLPVVTGTTGQSLSAKLLAPLNKKWIIVPDRKEEESAWKLKIALGFSATVKELDWPYPCKDPDEIRTKKGSAYLYQLLGVEHE